MHSLTLGKHWNPFSARATYRTPLGRRSPDYVGLVGWGGRNPFPIPTHSQRRFRRFWLGAFGASEVDAGVTPYPGPPNPGPPSRAFWIRACQQLPIFWERMHQNAWFCIINIFFRGSWLSNSRGVRETLPQPLPCPPPKAGAPPLLSGWLRPWCYTLVSEMRVDTL